MNPANKSNSSHVTNIGITSPLGKAKELCIPDKGKQPPPYGALRAQSTLVIVAESVIIVNMDSLIFQKIY